ncbi:MAG TPA: DUF1778 domain-containing protein [Bryobacteraceae bacterium]|nr:DUF1778 domain-containing protein [Bryobacteraceae bacterium]
MKRLHAATNGQQTGILPRSDCRFLFPAIRTAQVGPNRVASANKPAKRRVPQSFDSFFPALCGAARKTKFFGRTAFCRIMASVMAQEIQTTARLEARLPNDIHALLKRAAEIEGRSLTDFVVSAAREAACRTIEATEIIRLSVEDQRQIAKALLNPPKPTPALKKAFRRRRELFGLE